MLGISDYSLSAKVIEFMILNYQQFIITHPSRNPASALEQPELPQLPTVYSPAQLYIHLVRSKSTIRSGEEERRRSLSTGSNGRNQSHTFDFEG